uniref:Wsv023-like protein n=1 Tax=Trachysalambria curvirostris nimavirus TaxID=2984282 RepID=A0A9C7BR21_9VIRU|nr:MAG: wsv023-like protein [Trachysalambria curvirostris nimavirus]
MDSSRDSRSVSAVEIDHAKIINDLTSLLSVVDPPASSILDSGNMIRAPGSESAEPSQPYIKLDREVCNIISKDIEAVTNNNKTVDTILAQFLAFAEGSSESSSKVLPSSPPPPSRQSVTGIAASTTILSPLIKLEWLACICTENKVAVENLSETLDSGHQFWKLFPSALYATFDSMIQLLILWMKLGSQIDLEALASGKGNVMLPNTDPQVIHTGTGIESLLATRKRILSYSSQVPVTEILRDIIIPVLKAIDDRLK